MNKIEIKRNMGGKLEQIGITILRLQLKFILLPNHEFFSPYDKFFFKISSGKKEFRLFPENITN